MPYANNTLRTAPSIHSFYDQDNNQIHLNPEIQLLRIGTFNDSFGEITIDINDLESMVKNFDDKVRRVDIAMDIGHDTQGEAIAWLKRLYIVNNSELWSSVEYTPNGKRLIDERSFRYVSAEFAFEYTDNETGATFGPTIFGCAATNRPFVKDMQVLKYKEINMPAPVKDTTDVTKILTDMDAMKVQMTEMSTKLTEQETKSKKLSDDLEVQIKKNIELVDKNKAIEKKKEFDEKLHAGLVCEAQREAYMKDDMVAFISNIMKPNLEAKSTNFTDDGKEKVGDVQDEVIALAKEKVKADTKLTLSEAIVHVLKEKPALSKKYNELFN